MTAEKSLRWVAILLAFAGWGGVLVCAQTYTFTTLYAFTNGSDGANPYDGLIQDSNGVLYGTAYSGGLTNTSSGGATQYGGTLFSLKTDGTSFATLREFNPPEPDGTPNTGGAKPSYTPVFGATAGTLFGVTSEGGSTGYGAFYTIDTNGSSFADLLDFNTNANSPEYTNSGVIRASDGYYYGVGDAGGSSQGTLYKVSSAGVLQTLVFSFTASGTTTGVEPVYDLMQGLDGRLYGVGEGTSEGGQTSAAIAYAVTTGGTLTVLHIFDDFSGNDSPGGGLIQDSSGTLYGVNFNGSTGAAEVYSMGADGSNYTILHSLTSSEGLYPYLQLLLASDGKLYGAADSGGAHGYGSIFRLNTDGTSFTVLYSFTGSTGSGGDHGYPNGSLIQGLDGAIYGTTSDSDPANGFAFDGNGSVFKLSLGGPTVTAGATVTFTGGGSAVTLDAGLTVSDSGATNLTGATATIGSHVSGDTLNFTNQNSITGSYDASTGVLTLSGTDTLAHYQTALESVTYSFSPTDGDPTNGGTHTSRTISWQVTDSGSQSSPAATSTLDVTHVAATVTAGATATFDGGGSAVVLDGGLTVSDPDSGGNLTGATVTITSHVSGDTLNFTNQNSITGSYDASTGVLTLSGTDTLAHYQAALESITYSFSPSDGDPTGGGGHLSRTIDWVVNDGVANSATATSTLDTVHVAPTLTLGGSTPTYVAGGSAVAVNAALTVSDPDNGGNLTGATVRIMTGFLAGDMLNFTNQNAISGSYDSATGVLTLTGTASVADYQTALQSVTFSSSSSNPTNGAADTSRVISWSVSDGSTSNGTSNAETSTLDVQGVPSVTAGAAATFDGGGSAVTLDSGLTVTDFTANNLTGATVTIGAAMTGDTLNFANQNSITGSYNATTGVLTLAGTDTLAHYQTALASVTYSFSPSDGDPTGGGVHTSRTISWQVTDSNSASSPAVTSTLATVHVAPTVAAGGTASFTGGGSSVSLDPTLTVDDVDSGGNLAGATVTIGSHVSGDTLNFTNQNSITGSYDSSTGVLTLSGTDTLAHYQTALESITYTFTPSDGDPTGGGGHLSRTIDWVVSDGSTSNGTSSTGTSTLSLSHVAPSITASGTVTYQAGGSAAVLAGALALSDPDSGGSLTGATVQITAGFLAGDALNFINQNGITGSYDSSTGVLTLSGTDTLAHYQTALESITYSSGASDPTNGGADATRTIAWQVTDGSSSNGASNQPTIAVDVESPPVVTAGATATFDGGGSAVALDPGLSVADPSTSILSGATVTIGSIVPGDTLNFTNQNAITGSYNATTGVLTLAGADTLADYQTALASVTYSFSPANGDPTGGGVHTSRTINWVATDTDGLSSAAATSTLDTVHMAPTVAAGATAGFTGGGSAVSLDGGVTVADADSGNLLTGATVTIGGFIAGDVLTANTTGLAISASYNAGTGVLTLTGTDTLEDYQQALQSVTYSFNPANGDPTGGGSHTSRTIDWVANDGSTSNGTSATATSTLAVTHVAPSATAGGSATFSTGGSAVTLDGSVSISDVDSGDNLTGATITIATGFLSGDMLNFVDQSGITGSYNATTGVLTLTGTASVADYQTALDSITYSSSAADPTNGGADVSRTIDWVVNDGAASSGVVTSGISLAPAVIGVSVANGRYETGQALTFTVTFSSAVAVTGVPSLALTVGGAGQNATYVSGSGTTALVFTYTVQASDSPGPVSVSTPLALNGGTITAVSNGTAAVLAFSPPDTSGVSIVVVPILTWAAPAAIPYGTALSGTQLDPTANVAGSFSYDYGFGTVFVVGQHTITATFTPTDTTLYAPATAQVMISVSQGTPLLTWATPAAVNYGTALSSTQLNATANVGGSFSYSPALGAVPEGGSQSLSVTFTPTDTIDYGSATAQVTLTVNALRPTLAWSAPAAIPYGTALSSAQLNATASIGGSALAGTFTYSPAGGTVLGAGSQSLGVSFTAADAADYTPVTGSTTLTVNKATPTITWTTPADIAYGTALSGTQLNATATANGSSVAGTLSYTPASGTVLNAGAGQSLSVSFTPSDTSDYNAASGSVSVNVAKASQTLTFPGISGIVVGTPVSLSATTSSNLTPITFALVSGNAILSGSTLTVNDTNPVVVSATQVGNANYLPATVSQTLEVGGKATQTLTFPAIPQHYTNDAPFQLTASSSSGLPVRFTLISGPATVNGTTLVPTGIAGTVTVQASQPGNAFYQAATPVAVSFHIVDAIFDTYFGSTNGQSGSSAGAGGLKPQAVATDDNIAATLSLDGTNGFLVGYLPSTSQGFIVAIAPDSNGNFAVTTSTVGTGTPVTLTITGTATAAEISGTIQPLGLTFGAAVDPAVGPTTGLAGLYQSVSVDTSSGDTYSIVGSQGEVFVLAVTPSGVTAGMGTVNTSDDSFSVQTAPAVTVTGTVDTATATITGTVTTPGGGTVSYAGTSSAVAATSVLTNMSALGWVTPTSPVIVGFVIDGPLSKTVVLRGVGPSLAPYGTPTPLAHPALTLYDASGDMLGSNAGWGGGADLTAAFAQVGAFALPAASTDAALEVTLQPGPYSIVISDAAKDNGGNALAEIYDASIDPSEVTQRLANVSTSGQVTASASLSGGFVIGGNSPKKVLVRGVGPSLAAYGVSAFLPDPTLAVYDASGTIVAQNNDWGTPLPVTPAQTTATPADITAAAASVGAFPLASASKDSALIVTLAPGTYSAVLSAALGATGTALVEVYELPSP